MLIHQALVGVMRAQCLLTLSLLKRQLVNLWLVLGESVVAHLFA